VRALPSNGCFSGFTVLDLSKYAIILKDKIGNTAVRNELDTFNLNNIIQNNRLSRIHHVESRATSAPMDLAK
jgi:hypothetical protein